VEKIVCHKSSNEAKKFIDENILKWGTPEHFVTFFANENFLLTPYALSSIGIQAVLETQHVLVEFSSLNCGYIGEGPRATEHLLKKYGVPEEKAELLITQEAIDISFDGQGQVSRVRHENFFYDVTHVHLGCGCILNEHTFLNVVTANIYMANPEMNNLSGLINCLQVMEPFAIEYRVNPQQPLMYAREFDDFVVPPVGFNYTGTRGINLIIRGKVFELFCFVDNRYLENLVNTICLSILKREIPHTAPFEQLKKLTHKELRVDELFKDIFRKNRASERKVIRLTRG